MANAKMDFSKLFSRILNEPPRRGEEIFAGWQKVQKISFSRWQGYAQADSKTVLAAAGDITNEEIRALAYFLNHHGSRGIVLTTMHMGDYLIAILAVLKLLLNRDVLIVRRKEPDPIESATFAHIAAIGLPFDVVRNNSANASLRIFRNLKKGGVVIILFDLSQTFGETVEVKFFGHPMQWVRGPAELAVRSNSFLVPIVSYDYKRRMHCRVHDVKIYRTDADVSKAAQSLVSMSQKYIKDYPEQWVHWDLIPEMLEFKRAEHDV